MIRRKALDGALITAAHLHISVYWCTVRTKRSNKTGQ